MAISYEYKIANLEYTNDDSKGVVVVHWRIEAKEDEELVDVYGSLNFVPEPNNPNYTPFDQLTKKEVIGWVKAKLNTEQIEQALAQKLNKKLNPTVVSGVPWSTEDETQEETN